MFQGYALVDFHVHLPRYRQLSQCARKWYLTSFPSEEVYDEFCDAYSDPGRYCELMAQEGIDYAVILAEETPDVTGIADNGMVADFCRGRSKLIPFCTIDPLRCSDMPGKLRALADDGFRGLKLYPTYNFYYPNDPAMYPLYEAAQELKLPVMFHTGSSVFKNSRLKYGNPIFYDDLAVDFPDLTIIMCHGGRGCWYDEAMAVTKLHSNVYIDVAGLPPKKLPEYFPRLQHMADKFLFGTDWPAQDAAKNAEAVLRLGLPDEATENILGNNAKRILGLKWLEPS